MVGLFLDICTQAIHVIVRILSVITMRNIILPVFEYVCWRNIFDNIVNPCSYLNRFILPVE